MKLCAVCRNETVERQHETVTLDECPDGHGMWLLESELLDAVRTIANGRRVGMSYDEGRALTLVLDHDVKLDDEVRDCPMCEQPMGSVEYAFTSGVVIDACPTHGIWLDAGELERLEAEAERQADPSSPESIEQEARRIARRDTPPEYVELRLSFLDVVRGMISGR